MSNIDDLDRLVAVFMKQEDEHFSLFNYIQTVNQETDQQLEKTEELEVGDLSQRGDGGTIYSVRHGDDQPEVRWYSLCGHRSRNQTHKQRTR